MKGNGTKPLVNEAAPQTLLTGPNDLPLTEQLNVRFDRITRRNIAKLAQLQERDDVDVVRTAVRLYIAQSLPPAEMTTG